MARPPIYPANMTRLPGFWVPVEVLKAAKVEAKSQGKPLTEVLREWLIQASGVQVERKEPKS